MNRKNEIWVFGDYRNYFQNRVTLQLIGRAVELAKEIKATVCAVVMGHDLDEWIGEYMAHGARRVYVVEDPSLKEYDAETYAHLTARLAAAHSPEILLVGATSFGREFAPRVAKRLNTGLTADCVGLAINSDGLLVQTAPSFGGNLLADIVTPQQRPQMATVRPGIFKEIPHNYEAKGEVIRIPLPKDIPARRIRLIKSVRQTQKPQKIEDAAIVICSGRGIGTQKKFNSLYELAELTDAEVGATRPLVYAGWADHEDLVGQAGKNIRPKILFSFGVSGAIQHTAAISGAEFIIAVNKNPQAPMMKMADVAICADAGQVCAALIRELKKRIR
ncbi:MAG: electron transfer flavoprotein subunit alpha/FixB family protein [Deltaproteobacteria bacterium]|nr:electron transfer flavoprotein subunit alpha/FixB family protein [Deltaproteobacteria bacterium]